MINDSSGYGRRTGPREEALVPRKAWRRSVTGGRALKLCELIHRDVFVWRPISGR